MFSGAECVRNYSPVSTVWLEHRYLGWSLIMIVKFNLHLIVLKVTGESCSSSCGHQADRTIQKFWIHWRLKFQNIFRPYLNYTYINFSHLSLNWPKLIHSLFHPLLKIFDIISILHTFQPLAHLADNNRSHLETYMIVAIASCRLHFPVIFFMPKVYYTYHNIFYSPQKYFNVYVVKLSFFHFSRNCMAMTCIFFLTAMLKEFTSTQWLPHLHMDHFLYYLHISFLHGA